MSGDEQRTVVLMMHPPEIELGSGVARALRQRNVLAEAWVYDERSAQTARDLGAFDVVVNLTQGFRRRKVTDAAELAEIYAKADVIEAEVGEPFLHRTASQDRTLTNHDHLEVPPADIPERWTWPEFCELADCVAGHVRERAAAVAPIGIVGELGGFTNRVVTRYAKVCGIRVMGAMPVQYHLERVYFTDRLDGQWPELLVCIADLMANGIPDDALAAAREVLAQLRTGRTMPNARTTVATFLPTRWQRFGPPRVMNALMMARRVAVEDFDSPHRTMPQLLKPSMRLRRKLRRAHTVRTFDRVAVTSMPATRHAVYFLHAQPEVTVEGWAFDFSDQVTVIRNIAARLPAGMTLAVKEHAIQAGLRDPSFYGELMSIPGVVLVDQVTTKDALAGAEIVFTLTGTVGLEAMCLRIPCVIFGSVYYEHLPGVWRVRSFDELGTLLRAGLAPLATEEEIEAVLAARWLSSWPGHWVGWGSTADSGPEQTADAILVAVDDPHRTMQRSGH